MEQNSITFLLFFFFKEINYVLFTLEGLRSLKSRNGEHGDGDVFQWSQGKQVILPFSSLSNGEPYRLRGRDVADIHGG